MYASAKAGSRSRFTLEAVGSVKASRGSGYSKLKPISPKERMTAGCPQAVLPILRPSNAQPVPLGLLPMSPGLSTVLFSHAHTMSRATPMIPNHQQRRLIMPQEQSLAIWQPLNGQKMPILQRRNYNHNRNRNQNRNRLLHNK